MSTADRPFASRLGSLSLLRARAVVMGRAERALLVLALPVVGFPILLAAIGPADQAALWERAHLTLAATIGLGIATFSHRSASGRVREVRGWIAVAFAAWLAAEVVRDLGLIGFAGAVPADLVWSSSSRAPWEPIGRRFAAGSAGPPS